MITESEERQLQRDLRYYCIMGSQARPFSSQPEQVSARRSAPETLVNSGLVDPSGFVTPKGQEFMRA